MRTILLAVVVALADPAMAQPAAIAEASKLLAEGEFERALKKLDAAVKRTKVPAELAALHVARGRCLLSLSKRPQALAAFTSALEHDVSIDVGDDASPDAVSLFTEARAGFPGTLTVTVDAEASVRIDGRDLGPAPLTTRLPHGEHLIEVNASDGRKAQRSAQVLAGRPLEVNVALPDVQAAPPVPVVTAPPAPPSEPPLRVQAEPAARSRVGWIPLGAGVAVAAAGGVCLWQARVQYDRLTNASAPPLTLEEQQAAASTGATLQTLGWVGVGVGAAAAAAGAVLLALPPRDDSTARHGARPTVLFSLAPDGSAWLGVRGSLP